MVNFLTRSSWSRADCYAAVTAVVVSVLGLAWANASVEDYIRVGQVEIIDTGEILQVNVARELRRDFEGGYRVTIRSANSGYIVCSTGDVPVSYRSLTGDGRPTQLPDPMTLDYWAYGGQCTDVIERGLPPDSYTIETCHTVNHIWGFLPRKTKCWEPAIFFVRNSSDK